MIENVLTRHFDVSVNQASRVCPDYDRVVKFDEDGSEVVVYQEVDYPALVASRGSVLDWQLDSLLKAGINPNFPINTGNPTRLEGFSALGQFESVAESILNENNENSE